MLNYSVAELRVISFNYYYLCKMCFMKELFKQFPFDIIIVSLAYFKVIRDTIITWKQNGIKSIKTNLLILFLMTVIAVLLYY